ncbi:hypothetical protein GPJ56_004972 [Histomonas meleagridis]|uniref:uncharacterized protein n=1 Tax=Histomonas meleagridis TaxID=135588 RepID=UPI0035593DA1|nr:hypothetical protein GPJ56_004972 [Histomonas meleagridis]KAH0798502.1 hypothetical protein GO595_008367 [Histomonas meleagridis]
MVKIYYIPIFGKVFGGKSVVVRQIIDSFVQRQDLQVAGYTQPSAFEDGDRIGYDLTLIKNDRTLETYKFARLGKHAKPGKIPYIFEPSVFDEVYNTACSIHSNGKPAIVFLDEVGRLETMQKQGHHKSILKYIEVFQNAKSMHLIITYNERRKDETAKYMDEIGAEQSTLSYDKSNESITVQDFCNQILEEALK